MRLLGLTHSCKTVVDVAVVSSKSESAFKCLFRNTDLTYVYNKCFHIKELWLFSSLSLSL